MTDYSELKRLAEAVRDSDIDWEPNQKSYDYFQALRDPRVVPALIAENERLESEAVYSAAGFDAAREEISKLRAEVAGLKTGYEAYERVNVELKAEVGALRRDKSEPCDGCFMADAEVLRKDAGRYRWLRRAGNTKAIALVAEHCLDALDEAIDAALGQGEQS